MYRVMLIDDELPARQLLKASIDWEGLGLEYVGEAASGIEAINIIDEIRPDVVFVDISMPFMNGIDFTKVATKRYPDLIVIILTGFDDFEYARQCVSLPVVEYMLKPIVRSDIHEVLQRVVTKLDERIPRQDDIDREIENLNSENLSSENLNSENLNSENPYSGDLEQITQYLRENYTDSAINLTSVAQQFGFNSSYLSRKFKQETGMSFVEYLMKCRMEKAMELGKAGKKMFMAASEVGIPDPNYFSRCFKKYTGVSFSEYTASLKG